MSVIIMVDGCASISKKILTKYNLTVLPYLIDISSSDTKKKCHDNENVLDNIDVKRSAIKFSILDENHITRFFQEYIDNGDDILYLSMSSKISSAYKKIKAIANNFKENNLMVIDTLCVGEALTLLAILACERSKEGYGLKQVANYIEDIKHKVKNYYVVGETNSLFKYHRCKEIHDEYLDYYRRIPIASVNKGNIVLTHSAKNLEIAKQIITDMTYDALFKLKENKIVISYSSDKSNADMLRKFILKKNKEIDVETIKASNPVSVNVGDGSIGISFLVEEY